MRIHSLQGEAGHNTAPKHLVTLLQTCKEIYGKRILASAGKKDHLQKGLLKLQEVHETVNTLQQEAEVKQVSLKEKQAQANEAMARIKEAMSHAGERKQEMAELEKSTGADEEATRADRDAVEAELAEVRPILEGAQKAVGAIRQDHLTEIRSLKMPPEPIADVMQGVLRLMGNYDASWGSMKKFLAGAGMVQRILNFDIRSIDADTRRDVKRWVEQKSNSFDQQVIYRVSVAAAPLAKWVIAVVQYS